MNYQWEIRDADEQKVKELQQSLKIHPILCQLLVQRGVETFDEAKAFFRPQLEDLHNPFLLKDMEQAVDRLHQAVIAKEKILLYGDYDVDGTTSVALMYSYLADFYQNIDYYIPDRYGEGYGISFKGIDFAAEHNYSLMISLDCGIKAMEKIDYATQKGIDFIICDHHTPGDKLPAAVAVLDPKRKDCIYPFKELSGCGVGFKLCQAYAQKHGKNEDILFGLLDFLAVSIACDIVPIVGENRILAHYGLQQLNTMPSLGLKNIIELLQLTKDFTVGDVVFKIGPRINAAGRIKHARQSVDVLLGKEDAKNLQELNIERKELDSNITQEALNLIENIEGFEEKVSTVVCKEDWHKGVVGIVASRLIEQHYKPTVVLCESNGKLTGSARSVKGFNVYAALDACSDLFDNFGGHAYAAGLTLKKENLDEFIIRFEQAVSERILPEQLRPKIRIDAQLNFKDINDSFYNILQQLAPFGPENMRPVFLTKNVKDAGYTRVVGEKHLKLHIKDKHSKQQKGIAFQQGYQLESIQRTECDICYVIEENVWNNQRNIEINVKDIRAQIPS
ncbi:MAG: single-stranded-DNA-specific exonuclease RecJ [Chitinophagales bacterium]